jgi:hypothetical protein
MEVRAKLSVHMMVRNSAGVIGRALRSLCGVANEVCFVDTGSTDGTPELIAQLCGELGFACRGQSITPASRPDLYFEDVPGSYGPFELSDCDGSLILRDWAAARNLALELCQGEYVMKLDADDEVMDPSNVMPALEWIDARREIDVLCCPYEVMNGDPEPSVERVEMYTRIWRNLPTIRFKEVCHENVDWVRRADGRNWTMAGQGLTVRDWRDCRGADVRVPHRNLKVLLREYCRAKKLGFSPSQHVLIYLADEAAEILPYLALEAVNEVACSSEIVFAWTSFVRGRCLEKLGELETAINQYHVAGNCGWPRGHLRADMLRERKEPGRWIGEISGGVLANEGHFYPMGASRSELCEARGVLSKAGNSKKDGEAVAT